jgi:hypothetical protein
MNAETKVKAGAQTVSQIIEQMDARTAGLLKLREPFPHDAISKLPKPTKKQTDEVKADFKKGVRCKDCGAWHHPEVVHLDYVGHAALTDRLLKVDPEWSWEPVAFGPNGLPQFDQNGGLWIRLTILGVTRLGYGDAEGKQGGNAVKEAIGDALRNAGMRFGAALELWHKGDLPSDDDERSSQPKHDPAPATGDPQFITEVQRDQILLLAETAGVPVEKVCARYGIDAIPQLHADSFDKCANQLRATIKSNEEKAAKQPADILDDSIPY